MEPVGVGAASPPGGTVTLIIPTLNEAESIGAVLAEVPRTLVGRVIVADGGSVDGTAEIVRGSGAELLAAGPGYGRACLHAAEAAGPQDVLVFMDGDGADDPSAIVRMVRPIADGTADFVVGSRVRGTAAAGSLGAHQRLAGLVLGGGVRLLCGVRYTDMCAFRAIRRDALLALGMRETTYGWNLEMQMRAARAGLRVVEIPVDYRTRLGGASKVAGTLRGSLRAGARILAAFVRLAAAPRPSPLSERA